jgi:hypothetical protein
VHSILHNVTFDCRDAYALAGFWSKVLDRPLHDDDHPGGPEALVEPKQTKNRLHLDLQPDHPRDADPEGNEFCVVRSAAERAATGG